MTQALPRCIIVTRMNNRINARDRAPASTLATGFLAIAAIAFALALLGPAQAQDALPMVSIEAPTDPVEVGEQFEVEVVVQDAEHVASFDFAIAYDANLLSFQRVESVGDFLTSGIRQDPFCPDPISQTGLLSVTCVTFDAPVCLGGAPGAAGSGLLGTVIFKAEGEGLATLDLVSPTDLVLDDIEPCDAAEGRSVAIEHTTRNATVQIEGGEDGFPWIIVGSIVGVVAALALLGVGALAYQRRTGADTPQTPPQA